MERKKLKSPPFLWQSAYLDGPSLELASQSLIGQSHLLHHLDRFTRNDSTLMYAKEETRLTSFIASQLQIYSSFSSFLICEMELGSLIIFPLPYGTMSNFVIREFWKESMKEEGL